MALGPFGIKNTNGQWQTIDSYAEFIVALSNRCNESTFPIEISVTGTAGTCRFELSDNLYMGKCATVNAASYVAFPTPPSYTSNAFYISENSVNDGITKCLAVAANTQGYYVVPVDLSPLYTAICEAARFAVVAEAFNALLGNFDRIPSLSLENIVKNWDDICDWIRANGADAHRYGITIQECQNFFNDNPLKDNRNYARDFLAKAEAHGNAADDPAQEPGGGAAGEPVAPEGDGNADHGANVPDAPQDEPNNPAEGPVE